MLLVVGVDIVMILIFLQQLLLMLIEAMDVVGCRSGGGDGGYFYIAVFTDCWGEAGFDCTCVDLKGDSNNDI